MFPSFPSLSWLWSSPTSQPVGAPSSQSASRATQALAQGSNLTPTVRDGQFALSPAYMKYAQKEALQVGANGRAAICEVRVFPGKKAPKFHGYQSGKEMDLTIPCPASNNSFNLAILNTVSGHAGQDKVESFAKQAEYVVEIDLQRTGSATIQRIFSSVHGPFVTNSPVYESIVAYHDHSGQDLAMGAVKKVSIDGLAPGDVLWVRGYPKGSAGVFGYVEGRQTRITLT